MEEETTQEKAQPDDEEIFGPEDTKCGFGSWRPDWLQVLASKKTYIIVYGLMGLNEFAFGAYFIGTISSIEKRFKLPRMITSMWDLGGMVPLIIIAYYGNAYHKTRWVSRCSLIAATACFVMIIPHIIYGPPKDISETFEEPVCGINTEGIVAFSIMSFAEILLGIGTAAYWTLGAAYLDDNVSKNKFPFYLAASIFLRYLGPCFGFLLSSYSLSTYIDSNVQPPFNDTDPQWIGAWYKGWIVLGAIEIFMAFLMSLFPKILPREKIRRDNDPERKLLNKKTRVPSFKDFVNTMWRLLRNPVLMANTLSTAFYIFGLMGYWIFMPKYMETQFRLTASEASFYTGSVGLVSSCVGVIVSGGVISKFKPRPRVLVGWTILTETADVLGHFAFVFLGCFKDDLFGSYNSDGVTWNLTAPCNLNNECGNIAYSPVCANGTTTFYSPCHAGCPSSNNSMYFSNCSCIEDGLAVNGPCPTDDCNNDFFIFMCIVCTIKFLSSTGRAGNTVIQYRSVKPEDKAISLGFSGLIYGLFVFVPAPVVFGSLLDSSCLVWKTICGSKGNCLLYHGQYSRYLLNYTAVGLFTMATVIDFGLFYFVGPLKIYDDDIDEKKPVEYLLLDSTKADEMK